jgi:TolA-binding protein
LGGLIMNRILTLVLMAFFIMSLFQFCASSRKETGAATSEEEEKQKELDEIEALLGITSEDKKADEKKPKKDDEMLGLLKSDDVAMQKEQAAKKPEPPVSDAEITRLKAQIEKKDLLIADLQAQIRRQGDQIYQLESQKQAASSTTYSSAGAIGDVPPGEYQQRYQQALDQFHGHDYNGALQMFESLLASEANNSLSDNAQYWIGECHYALRQYKQAIVDFEKVFTFPNSNKSDAAQFKLGLSYLRLGDNAKSREEFQRLLDVYPNSEYVGRAKEHLASL